MTTPDDPSDREFSLAALGTSDETVEELLSGGTDVDELISAGVLDDEAASEDTEGEEASEAASSKFTREEVLSEMAYEQKSVGSYGHGYRPISI